MRELCLLCKRENGIEASSPKNGSGFNKIHCPDCGEYFINQKAMERLIDIFNYMGTGTFYQTSEQEKNLQRLRDYIQAKIEKGEKPQITIETLNEYRIYYTKSE